MQIDVAKYIKTPFKEKGRSIEGWDCWGPAYVIYKEHLGIFLPMYLDDYESTEDKEELALLIESEKIQWGKVEGKPKPYDLLSIRLRGKPMHVGLYIGEGRFIHALEGIGTAIERVADITWNKRIIGYYRYAA